jgi:methyl acetate hydrolase
MSMKRLFLSCITALLLPGVFTAAASLDNQGASALSTFLDAAVKRGDVPAVVAMVVGPDRVLYHEAFGKLNVARDVDLSRDAIFNIASMTKPVTSLAVMMLVEEGRLGLEDDVARYLPVWKAPQVIARVDEAAGTYETRPATRPITIRHLLTHTSGIGYTFSSPTLAFVQKVSGGANELELPLVHEPGERWTYGASTRVLGELVEKLSGQRLDAFLESRIFRPLGMLNTAYAVPDGSAGRIVTAHQRGDDGTLRESQPPATRPSLVRGDGGLYSTAADYGRFLRMLLQRGRLDDARLLGERWVEEMTRSHTGHVVVQTQPPTNPLLSKPFPSGAGADSWGLGFQIAATASTSPAGRRPGSYTWGGIYNTHFWVDPDKEIGVILLMQVLPFYDERAMNVLQGFEEIVYRHLH